MLVQNIWIFTLVQTQQWLHMAYFGQGSQASNIYVADKAKLRCWELFRIKLYSEIFCIIPQIKEMHWEFKTVFISMSKLFLWLDVLIQSYFS